MHKLHKISLWAILPVILASFLTTSFLPVATYAVDNQKPASDNAKALAYFYTLRRCIKETFSAPTGSLSGDDINNFTWLQGYGLPLGAQFITDNGDWDGNVNCDGGGVNSSWRQDAVSAFGYSSNRDLLCNIMHPFQSIAPDETTVSRSAVEGEYNKCINGQGNLDVSSIVSAKNNTPSANNGPLIDMFDQSVGQKYFIDTDPIRSNGVGLPLYNLFYSTFTKFCQPQSYNGGSVGNDLEKVSVSSNYDAHSQSFQAVDVLVKKIRMSKQTDVIAKDTLPNMNGGGVVDSYLSCRQIVDRVNYYAPLAANVISTLPPDQQDAAAKNAAVVSGSKNTDNSVSQCQVEGVGWIICPVVRLLANVTDASYGFITSLLTTQPLLTTGTSEPIYKAWSLMRNIANVAFVIAFLLIIFSQLSSVGISNYGIKKMLPRIVVAAILVNLSYWICSIAVDLSNIFGMSVNGLFKAAGANISGVTKISEIGQQALTTGTGWVGIAGLVLAGVVVTGVVFYMCLSALLPALIVAFAAIVTVFLVLTLRQALIILLIVISPLAFVAFLLPNTEGLFKKWRELFQTLLLMFPIIAGIFGASALASQVVMQSANGDYKIVIQIMGALMSILPLALTPVVMKSAGGLLNRFGGIVNNPNKGPFDRMRKGAENYRDSRKEYRKLKALNGFRTLPGVGVATRIGTKRRAVLANRQRELKSSEAQLVANAATNADNDSYARKLSRGAGDGALQRAVDSAVSIQASIQAEEVKAANARIDRTVLDQDALRSVALGNGGVGRFGKIDKGDTSAQHAAIQQTVAAQDAVGIAQLLANSHTFDAESQKVLADSLTSSRPGFVSFGTIAQVRQGDKTKPIDVNQLVDTAVNNGTYSAQKLATLDKDEVGMVADSLLRTRTTTADQAAVAQVKTDAATALSDPKLGAGKNRENLTNITIGAKGKIS